MTLWYFSVNIVQDKYTTKQFIILMFVKEDVCNENIY